ncbi:hypothetical protein [Brevibacterium aurantiacum]|uniref:hypothetical protein n=1 Tax=Brevibacterium aurantiacum TaxID=273384 RepID=UPI003F8DBD44
MNHRKRTSQGKTNRAWREHRNRQRLDSRSLQAAPTGALLAHLAHLTARDFPPGHERRAYLSETRQVRAELDRRHRAALDARPRHSVPGCSPLDPESIRLVAALDPEPPRSAETDHDDEHEPP